MNIFIKRDGVQCRLCGAEHARPHDNDFGICETCHTNAVRSNGSRKLNKFDFVNVLAKRLASSANKIQQGKFNARCEVISTYGINEGYQCACHASTKINGRYVCAAHSRNTCWNGARRQYENKFVTTDEYLGPKERFSRLVLEVCDFDNEIKQMVLAGLHLRKK